MNEELSLQCDMALRTKEQKKSGQIWAWAQRFLAFVEGIPFRAELALTRNSVTHLGLDHVQEVGDWEVIETNLTADGKGVFEEMRRRWNSCYCKKCRIQGESPRGPIEGKGGVETVSEKLAGPFEPHFPSVLDKEDDRGANVEIWVNDDLGWNPCPSLSEPNEFQPIEIVKQAIAYLSYP